MNGNNGLTGFDFCEKNGVGVEGWSEGGGEGGVRRMEGVVGEREGKMGQRWRGYPGVGTLGRD